MSRASWFGLIRGSDREHVYEFSKYIEACSAYMTGFWDVMISLNLTRVRGLRYIEVRVDSTVVVHSLNSKMVGSVGVVDELCYDFFG